MEKWYEHTFLKDHTECKKENVMEEAKRVWGSLSEQWFSNFHMHRNIWGPC